MKLLYHSAAPWVNTGYGRVTRELVPRLQEHGIDVAVQCLNSVRNSPVKWHGGVVEGGGWDHSIDLEKPVEVYPSSSKFGLNDYEEHFEQADADLHFTHFDTWMEPAKETIPRSGIPYVSYCIIDHAPVPDAVLAQTRNAEAIVSMSKFGQQELDRRGVDSEHIPHGINPEDFYPIRETDEEGIDGLEVEDQQGGVREVSKEDTFFVGIVAANHGDRKNIPNMMEGFEKFRRVIDGDALLHLHTEQNSDNGYNLWNVQKKIGIPKENIAWTREDEYQNCSDAQLNELYNLYDVLVNCSYGESWGLTITEAQAAGTPCIVSNFSSMPEQLGAGSEYGDALHGLTVEPSVGIYREKVSTKQYVCSPEDIGEAIRHYYRKESVRKTDGRQASQYVRDQYTWDDHVAPRFADLFKRVVSEL